MLVNIYNEGLIPWINKEGPIYGMELTPGLYGLLFSDSRISIEITTREKAIKLAKEAIEKKKNEEAERLKVQDTVKITKNIQTQKTADKTEDEDAEIEKILNSTAEEKSVFEEATVKPVEQKIKKYSQKELSEMTKAQMKAILVERGYTSGPFAGKYHDTLADLIEKVKKTQ